MGLSQSMSTSEQAKQSRARTFVLSVAALVIGIVAALLLLEVLLRIHNPIQARIKGNRIVLLTNKQYEIKNDVISSLDPVVTVRRNSLGFRGPDPPAGGLDQTLSLITVGGSTTQCFFLSEDKTWTARLGAKLSSSFRDLWVNNAGLDGHSAHGHLVLMEDHIRKLRPKVVIFLVGANDVARDPDVEFDTENIKGAISFRSPTGLVKSLSPYSEVASLVANLYRSLNAYRHGLLHQKINLRTQGYFDAGAEEENRYLAEVSEERYLRGYENRLRRLLALCRREGIQPVLVTQPLLAGGGLDDVSGIDLSRVRVNPRANGRMSWKAQEIYNDVTRRVGAGEGAQVIDLGRQLTKSSRYFYDFIHFTNEGAEAVAEILYREVCPALAVRQPQFVRGACASETR
jgi:lysophospholipase L1-like esterase